MSLYQKYRSKNFSEVVGQNHIKTILQNEISSGQIAHAYLFCGPRGIGKTTFARLLAKTVNCTDRQGREKNEACNNCEVCENIINGQSMDIVEIDAASNTGVDNVRDNIIKFARVAPSKCAYKVFIIDEVHMLSISAFNALLKTLEEPPRNVIFILCTTEIHKVPLTIISRCQRFDFGKISAPDIVHKLQYIIKEEKIKIDEKILFSIARLSGGHMRDAESLLAQIISIGGQEITSEEADLVLPRNNTNEIIKFIKILVNKDSGAAISLINDLFNEGLDLQIFTKDLVEVLRKIMLTKVDSSLSVEDFNFGEKIDLEINEISKNVRLEDLIFLIERFNKAQLEIKNNFILQLPLELVVIEFCRTTERIEVNEVAESALNKNKVQIKQSNVKSNLLDIKEDKKNEVETINSENKSSISIASQSNETEKPLFTNVVENKEEPKNINTSFEKIKSSWNDFLIKIKPHNNSLAFILKTCALEKIEGNSLYLAFKYKFHKDRVDNPQIKNLMKKVLLEMFGESLEIETVINENLEIQNIGSSDMKSELNNSPVSKKNEDKSSEEVSTQKDVQNISKDNDENNNMLDNVLKTFGGKVVRSG